MQSKRDARRPEAAVRGTARPAPGPIGRTTPFVRPSLTARGRREAEAAATKCRTLSKGRNPVAIFMRDIGLPQYIDPLLRDGFDDMETLLDIQDKHLKAIGFLPGHVLKMRKRLRQAQENLAQPTLFHAAKTDGGGMPRADGVKVAAVPPQCEPGPSTETIEVVQRSWQQMRPLVGDVAEALYKNMFLLNPQSKSLFSMAVRNRYRDWANPLLEADHNFEKSPALRELFSKMINAVGSAVMGLHNPGKVVRDLTALGMRHASYDLKEEYILTFGQSLLLAFRGHCSFLTSEADQAWMEVFGFVSSTVAQGLRSARTEEAQVRATLAPEQSMKTLLASRPRAGPDGGVKAQLPPFNPPTRQSLQQAEPQHVGMVPSTATICTVQQSWMVVKELGVANIGEIMYTHLFKIAPVTKELFPISVRNRYRDWSCSEEEVENVFDNSMGLRNLFAKVVEAVGSAVAGLHNISRLVSELNALGMRHINYNMREEFFAYGGQALVLTLQDGLGEDLTDEVKQAWVAVYEFISACIISGLRFAQEKESLMKKLQQDVSPGSPRSLNSYLSQNASTSTKCSEDLSPRRPCKISMTLPRGKDDAAGLQA